MAEKDVPVVKYGDVTQRVGVEVIRKRGVDVEKLIKMLIANAAAEFASTYYYYTILRMHLAGHEDYKEICEDARLEDRAHWELIVPRIYELGGGVGDQHLDQFLDINTALADDLYADALGDVSIFDDGNIFFSHGIFLSDLSWS